MSLRDSETDPAFARIEPLNKKYVPLYWLLIGILPMVYDNPHISGKSDPLYTLHNQGLFFAQLQYQFLPETKHDNYSPNSPNLPEKNNQKQISHGKIQTAGCKALGFSNCRATCIWKDPNIKIQ